MWDATTKGISEPRIRPEPSPPIPLVRASSTSWGFDFSLAKPRRVPGCGLSTYNRGRGPPHPGGIDGSGAVSLGDANGGLPDPRRTKTTSQRGPRVVRTPPDTSGCRPFPPSARDNGSRRGRARPRVYDLMGALRPR